MSDQQTSNDGDGFSLSSGDRRPGSNWFFQPGVVDPDGTRATDKVTARRATALETAGVSSLADKFMFFLPYVPLVVCPHAPDPVAEYCDKTNRNIELVVWDFDRQLVPQLCKQPAGLDTSKVFGVSKDVASKFFNFCKGIIVHDERSDAYFRIVFNAARIFTPGNVSGKSAEVLQSRAIDVVCFAVTSATHTFFLAQPPNYFLDLTFCKKTSVDKEICSMIRRFKREESDLGW